MTVNVPIKDVPAGVADDERSVVLDQPALVRLVTADLHRVAELLDEIA